MGRRHFQFEDDVHRALSGKATQSEVYVKYVSSQHLQVSFMFSASFNPSLVATSIAELVWWSIQCSILTCCKHWAYRWTAITIDF